MTKILGGLQWISGEFLGDMTKSSKLIATLGVVAGLGVASLPLSTFAVSTSGNAVVDVEVLPAIAMTIAGDNDSQNDYTDPTRTGGYGLVDVYNDGTGSIEGKRVDGHTAAATTTFSSSYTSILPNAIVEGTGNTDFGSLVTVYTNNTAGYNMNVIASTTDGALISGSDSIAAAAAVSKGTSEWSYRITNANADAQDPTTAYATGVTSNTYMAMDDTATALINRATETSGGDATVVKYAVSTSSDQPTGVYTTTLTYTATTN